MEQNNQNLVPISASDILKKCRSHEDIKNIAREIGNYNNTIIFKIGYIFPDEKGFDSKFFLQWGRGEKIVNIYFNNFI